MFCFRAEPGRRNAVHLPLYMKAAQWSLRADRVVWPRCGLHGLCQVGHEVQAKVWAGVHEARPGLPACSSRVDCKGPCLLSADACDA